MKCRCGFDGNGEHPCHGGQYRCRKPAKQYFYNPRMVALTGMQMKVEVVDTWACEDCWKEYNDLINANVKAKSGT